MRKRRRYEEVRAFFDDANAHGRFLKAGAKRGLHPRRLRERASCAFSGRARRWIEKSFTGITGRCSGAASTSTFFHPARFSRYKL
jgi:hypothetical protein